MTLSLTSTLTGQPFALVENVPFSFKSGLEYRTPVKAGSVDQGLSQCWDGLEKIYFEDDVIKLNFAIGVCMCE